jgi:type I restriction enzyme S subunit
MNLREIVLQDLISFTKDGEWGKDKDTGSSVEMYVIRGTDFQDVKAGYFGNLPIRWIPKHIADKKTLEAGDVLIELAGGTEDNPTGRTCYVSEEFIANSDKPLTVASFSRFIRFDNSICDSNYIYWMLHFLHKYRIIKKYHVQHTGTSRFQWTLFSNKEKIKVHELPIQRKIANILSAYDELIENNKKRIKLLEEMAEEIYKEWFVRMRFPGYEKTKFFKEQGKQVPYGTNGALPEGWERTALTAIVDVLSGGTPKTEKPEFWNGQIPFFSPKDYKGEVFCFKTESYITKLGLRNCNSRLFEEDTIIITARGSVGNILLTGCSMAMNQSCFALAGKNNISNYYVYKLLLANADHFKKVANGATFGAITIKTFEQTKVVLPSISIIEKFNQCIFPFFEEIKILSQKNILLQETRDLLLPRLMSGKLNVEGIA